MYTIVIEWIVSRRNKKCSLGIKSCDHRMGQSSELRKGEHTKWKRQF